MSRSSTSQGNACVDPLDALIDFSGGDYDTMSYNSPSISPSSTSKPHFVRPVAAPNAMVSSSQQPMSGPSHQYDMYKQQTGIPSGALATTHALNQQSGMFNNYSGFSNSFADIDNFNDFKPAQGYNMNLDLDMDYGTASPSAEPAFFYPEQTLNSQQGFIDPSAIQDQNMAPAVVPSQSSNVGRLWPGMHQQQAALAKAQAQQKQQQQLIQQQQRQSSMAQQPKHQKSKSQSADPIVEEKISQLLNSMRQSSVVASDCDDSSSQNMTHAQRMKKDEEDMDEDERLLASEEGKKLSSKERRQLRNKVSARAFRSRRKEYIGQLEGEIAVKVNENSDLRAQNRALMEENTRLSDLTRMLLSSPSFSGFLDNLSQNTASMPAAQPKIEQQQPQQQAQPSRQVRKDVNPYAGQQTQMHMAMIPEQQMDFSVLDLNADAFAYQPQVFSVLSLPEPSFESSVLSGKSSNFVGKFNSEVEKVEMPVIERISVKPEATIEAVPVVDEEFDADPAFALFNDQPVPASSSPLDMTAIFGGIESEKAFARIELVDAQDAAATAEIAMIKVERIFAGMDSVMERLEAMTIDL